MMIKTHLVEQSIPIRVIVDSSTRPFLKSSQLLACTAWKAEFGGALTLSAQNHHDRRWLHKSKSTKREMTAMKRHNE